MKGGFLYRYMPSPLYPSSVVLFQLHGGMISHMQELSTHFSTVHSGVGNAAAAAALAAAPFRPKWCGKASSEPCISAEVGKGSTTPVIEYQRVVGELLLFSAAIVFS